MSDSKDKFTMLANQNDPNSSKISPWTAPTLSNQQASLWIGLHRNTLTTDLELIVVAQLQNTQVCPKVINAFVRGLIEYRQDTVVDPTHLNPTPYLTNMIEQLSSIESIEVVEMFFEKMKIKAGELPYLPEEKGKRAFIGAAYAQNTSEEIQRFLKWQETIASRQLYAELESNFENLQFIDKNIRKIISTYVSEYCQVTINSLAKDFWKAEKKAADRANNRQMGVRKDSKILRLLM